MRVAIIYRPRSAAPFEAGPMLMEAMGQWVETYSNASRHWSSSSSAAALVLADFDGSTELNRILAENPFTPFMDVEIMPVVEPRAAMAIYGEVVAALVATAQPSG